MYKKYIPLLFGILVISGYQVNAQRIRLGVFANPSISPDASSVLLLAGLYKGDMEVDGKLLISVPVREGAADSLFSKGWSSRLGGGSAQCHASARALLASAGTREISWPGRGEYPQRQLG